MNDPGGLKRPTRQQRTDGSAKASAEPFHLDHDLWDGICQLSCSIYFDFYGRGGGGWLLTAGGCIPRAHRPYLKA